MILKRYETQTDIDNELRMADIYCQANKFTYKHLGGLSTYDFLILKGDKPDHFLETKCKTSHQWSDWNTEIFPIFKWTFAKQENALLCKYLVEKMTGNLVVARLFDITHIQGREGEVKRREDQIGGSKKVVFINPKDSIVCYYI